MCHLVDHITGKVVVSDVDMCQDKYIFRFFNVLCMFKTTNTSRMSMLMNMTVIPFLPQRQAVVISTTHIFLELHPKYQEYYFLLTVSRSLSSSNTRSLSPSLHLSSCTKRFKHILISLWRYNDIRVKCFGNLEIKTLISVIQR